MHFLCLHGIGTNSQILEMQTAAIRYQLGPSHTYDFVDGGMDYEAEQSVAHLASPSDEFYAYFDHSIASSILSALNDLENLISEAYPPYDAILGFSQGACLAATMLLRDANSLQPTTSSQIKFAILLSPGMAMDYEALLQDKIEPPRLTVGGPRIRIPTALVYGDNDTTTIGHGAILRKFCLARNNETAVHHLGHSIPGPRNRIELAKAVATINRASARVEGNSNAIAHL